MPHANLMLVLLVTNPQNAAPSTEIAEQTDENAYSELVLHPLVCANGSITTFSESLISELCSKMHRNEKDNYEPALRAKVALAGLYGSSLVTHK